MLKNGLWKKSAAPAIAVAMSLALVLSGCGSKEEKQGVVTEPAKASVQPTAAATAQAPKQTQYPLTLKDASGTEVTFEKAPERIVSLAPSETETVFAVGAGDKVVGVDKWSDYPEEAKAKPKMGDMNTNIEAVVAAKPDVVFASASLNKKAVEQLRGLNVKVYASNPATIDQAIERVEIVGQILNKQEQAKKTADEMKADKKKVTDAVKNAPPKKVYMEFNPGWTVGDGEFMSEMVALAGGVNVGAGKKGWYQIDPEAIIKANPEVIIYSKDEAGMGSILDEMKKRPGWDGIEAMKAGKLTAIEANLTNRVGPRITKGLVEMAKAIHPEAVK